jgi:hypothetical protein
MPLDTKKARWELPSEIDPAERICFVVSVPKNRGHIAAFRGALLELARWYSWKEDEAHTAALVANVWKDIYNNVRVIDCVTKEPLNGSEIEDFMPLRVDCDCRVWITCCDGTEKELVTSGMLDQSRQRGAGEGPHTPGEGQSVQDCYQVQANQQYVLPFSVSPGDKIEIISASGAGYDGSGSQVWNCPDGHVFFGGACVGVTRTDGGDPVPAAPHMSLVFQVGSSFYAGMSGPITIGGTGLQQVAIQVNDSAIGNNSGSYTVCVKWTSANSTTWEHTFDLQSDIGPWVNYTGDSPDTAQWTPGQGILCIPFTYVPNGNTYSGVQAQTTFPSRTITGVQLYFDRTPGNNSGGMSEVWFGVYTDIATLYTITPATEDPSGYAIQRGWSGSAVATKLIIEMLDTVVHGTPTGSGRLYKVVVTGLGTDPF